MDNMSDFQVGDPVVYPLHGVGEVIALENKKYSGTEVLVYVIRFTHDKMILRVPVGNSKKEGLRPLSSENIIKKAIETLASKPLQHKIKWNKKVNFYESKLNSGDLIAVAEVIRDLHNDVVNSSNRSYSRLTIYDNSLNRLAREIAYVKNLAYDKTVVFIKNMLKNKKTDLETNKNVDNSDIMSINHNISIDDKITT